MRYFPQLETGAVVQFPVERRQEKRTIRNAQGDGRMWKAADAGWSRAEWRLGLTGSSAAELAAIEELFNAVEGRLGSFTFLDPCDNLLAWSEDPSAGAWTKDPFLQVTIGVADPLGTTRASRLTNASGNLQKIAQNAAVPGWYQYCLSVWVRSEQAGQATVTARTASSSAAKTVATGPVWARVQFPFKLTNADELLSAGLELPAGGAADVFGFQLEAQPATSKYKKTQSRSGVYAEAHFASDVLEVRAEGPDSYGCVIEIVAR